MNLNNILSITALAAIFTLAGCREPGITDPVGKIKRESISLTNKLPGRIEQLLVSEGDFVKKGDTLAILYIPEVDAKVSQAQGAVKSASAQYEMAESGATANQLKQLEAKHNALKEQAEFAKKSFDRVSAMFADSLISPQQHDEAFAKYQGARAQYDAVKAELAEAKLGVRYESRQMALGQKERATGALSEAEVAYNERYITAPTDMMVETVSLREGELATPGYTIFQGALPETTWFRITLPESKIATLKQNDEVDIYIPYLDKTVKARVSIIKQLAKYANITTAYPDYQMEESIFEVKIIPLNIGEAASLLNNASIILKK